MHQPVVAIGLDAADPVLIDRWMAQGHLPALARLRAQGIAGRLQNLDCFKNETPWTTFLTGCLPETTGHYSPIKFYEGSYEVDDTSAYDFREYPPFYALGEDYRVAVFDVPQSVVVSDLKGLQMLGWGAHSAQTPSRSDPEGLFAELVRRYGDHPAHRRDYGDWFDPFYQERLQRTLEEGIRRRTAICSDLLQRGPWDLFLTAFSELHAPGHDLFHLSQPDHPLYGLTATAGSDPLLQFYKTVDRAVGELAEQVPTDAHLVVFSVNGTCSNYEDLPSMILLAESCYRFSFPGQWLLTSAPAGARTEPMIPNVAHGSWSLQVRKLRHEPDAIRRQLRRAVPGRFHHHLDRMLGTLPGSGPTDWQPGVDWYRSFWPTMRAFALPSLSEGYIRINLEGREPAGIVSMADYEATCEELSEKLYRLKDRDGKPHVQRVIRTRHRPDQRGAKLFEADLIVIWQDRPTDLLDSPDCGRIGPVPYRRPGGHRPQGVLFARGPRIAPGSYLMGGHVVDLAPTLLDLMGAPIPEHLEGRPLLTGSAAALCHPKEWP